MDTQVHRQFRHDVGGSESGFRVGMGKRYTLRKQCQINNHALQLLPIDPSKILMQLVK